MANTEIPLLVIDEKDMPADVDRQIRELLCAAFSPDAPVFVTTRHWHGSAPEYTVMHRANDGAMDGGVAIVMRTIQAGTQRVRVAGVQNMAVHPSARGTGLGPALMQRAMSEARRRGVSFGLLFCLPALGRYYERLGWRLHDVDVRMDFQRETNIPIPGKNICMVTNLADADFPPGAMHLQGPDW